MEIDVYAEDLTYYVREKADNAERREILLEVEKEIKRLNSNNHSDFSLLDLDIETIWDIENLLGTRSFILDLMFQATESEVAHFRKVNNLLYELTLKTYRRTANLYRTLLKSKKDGWFDDDYDVEGSLRVMWDDESSTLKLEEDEYYGSDFAYMNRLLCALTQDALHLLDIVKPGIIYNPTHKPDITDVELDCIDTLDDGVSWAEASLRHPKLDSICICYAVHDICTHKPYSIPDLLRMNDFWCEAKLVCQHIVNQDGTRWHQDL